MITSSWEANVSTMPLSHLRVTFSPGGQSVRVAALVAAAVLMGGVTTAGHASSLSSLRLGAERMAVQLSARDEDVAFSVSEAMATIKSRTGASWDDLARIFGVSRQAVHSWVRGGAIKAAHEEKVRGLLARIEQLAALRPFQIRNRLLDETGNSLRAPLLAVDEPAILTADHTPLSRRLAIVNSGKTKILRT